MVEKNRVCDLPPSLPSFLFLLPSPSFHLFLFPPFLPSFLPSIWKVVAEPRKMPGFLAAGGEEFNPGPETRTDRSGLLCNRVLLEYKRDRESFWHRHQKGAERGPLCSPSAVCYIPMSKLLVTERKCLKPQSGTRPLPRNTHSGITLTQSESSQAIKRMMWILRKGRFPGKYIVSLT